MNGKFRVTIDDGLKEDREPEKLIALHHAGVISKDAVMEVLEKDFAKAGGYLVVTDERKK